MSDDAAIYVDAGRPATLNDGAGAQTDCRTLQEAVSAWLALPSAQKTASRRKRNAPTARSEKEKSIDAVSEAAIQRIVIASASARTTRGQPLSGIPPLDHVQMAANSAAGERRNHFFWRPRMPAGLLTLPVKVDAGVGSRWDRCSRQISQRARL